MKKLNKLFVGLVTLCLMFSLTSCLDKGSDSSDKKDDNFTLEGSGGN